MTRNIFRVALLFACIASSSTLYLIEEAEEAEETYQETYEEAKEAEKSYWMKDKGAFWEWSFRPAFIRSFFEENKESYESYAGYGSDGHEDSYYFSFDESYGVDYDDSFYDTLLGESYGVDYDDSFYDTLLYEKWRNISRSHPYQSVRYALEQLSNMLSSLLKLTEEDSLAQSVATIAINAARSAEDTVLHSTTTLIRKIDSLEAEKKASASQLIPF